MKTIKKNWAAILAVLVPLLATVLSVTTHRDRGVVFASMGPVDTPPVTTDKKQNATNQKQPY